MRKLSFLTVLLTGLFLLACSSDESGDASGEPGVTPPTKSSAKDILSFKFTVEGTEYEANISGNKVTRTLPDDTDLTQLTPTITVSDKATISPGSGSQQDFTDPVTYTVKAEDGSEQQYEATLSSQSSSAELLGFFFTNLAEGQASYSWINNVPSDIDTMYYRVPYLSPIKALSTNITIPEKATVAPASGETLDYTDPVGYKITAENGNTNEFMVMVDNSLTPLKIDGLVGNQFRDVPLGGDITFSVNQLNPVQDSIKVTLLGTQQYELEIKGVNYDTKEITAQLPQQYVNDLFRLKVHIEHDNFDTSDGFFLDKGEANFKGVLDYYDNSVYHPYETLLMPSELFNISVFLERSKIDQYTFALRKNGTDYPLVFKRLDVNFEEVLLEMPTVSEPYPEGGTGFSLVIAKNGQESVFDLINISGNPIEILVGRPSQVTATNKTTIDKGEALEVYGEHLYFPYYGTFNTTNLGSKSFMVLKNGGRSFFFHSNELDASGNLIFGSIEGLPSGTYDLLFGNNTEYENLNDATDTTIDITVLLGASDHPSLSVDSAVLYSDTHAHTPKQILVTFNGNIESVSIDKIVVEPPFYDPVVIQNYFTYPTTVLTGTLSDTDFNTLRYGNMDGYVVVTDNGVEYTLPFQLTYD